MYNLNSRILLNVLIMIELGVREDNYTLLVT